MNLLDHVVFVVTPKDLAGAAIAGLLLLTLVPLYFWMQWDDRRRARRRAEERKRRLGDGT